MVKTKVNRFASRIRQEMDKKHISTRELAEASEVTYEHARKLVNGLIHPSTNMARTVAAALGLNVKELVDVANEDKMIHKFGHVAAKLTGRNPELDPIDEVWNVFDDRDKQDIYAYVQMKAQARRAERRKAKSAS